MNRSLDVTCRPLARDEKNQFDVVRLSAALWRRVADACQQGGGACLDPTLSQLSKREASDFAKAILRGFEAQKTPWTGRAEYDVNQFRTRGADPHVHHLCPADAARVEALLVMLAAGGVSLAKTLPAD